MKTGIEIQSAKITVIGNINIIRSKIGLNECDFNYLNKKSYDELHELQNSLIEHYNEAVNNTK